MDTFSTPFSYEHQLKSNLFKQLFHFQTQLEDYNDESFIHQENIERIILEIDQLLDLLMIDID